MVFEELPGLFRIEVPLPGSPLKQLNAYLVRGHDRHLLVDNGFNMAECEQALRQALQELDAPVEKLDFFLTHLHSDHNGLTSVLRTPEARIFCSEKDGNHINRFIEDEHVWTNMMRGLGKHGFPDCALDELLRSHPGRIYASPEPLPITPVSDGQLVTYGNYIFMVIDVPGHTPGHVALFDPQRRFLICGDHVLGSITPNITAWADVEDSLGDYLRSLDKILRLPVQQSYPGHRAIIPDTHVRVRQLHNHHERRLSEVLAIVGKLGRASGFAVAARMHWALRGTWESYRVQQQCFAVGEAVAHLDHLAVLGRLRRMEDVAGSVTYAEVQTSDRGTSRA